MKELLPPPGYIDLSEFYLCGFLPADKIHWILYFFCTRDVTVIEERPQILCNVLLHHLVQESSEFYLRIRNHKDKIRLCLYTQMAEKLIHGVVSTNCAVISCIVIILLF